MSEETGAPTIEDYHHAVELFSDKLRSCLGKNFVSFVLIGSFGRGDAVPGWSDIDSIVVVENPGRECEERIIGLRDEVCAKCGFFNEDEGIIFDVFVRTRSNFWTMGKEAEQDLIAPSSWNLYDFKYNSRVVSGEDLLASIKVKRPDNGWINSKADELREYLIAQKEKDALAKGRAAVKISIEVPRLVLMKKEMTLSNKWEIAEEFDRLFPEEGGTAKRAAEMRAKWSDYKGSEELLNGFYEEALSFVNTAIEKHITR